MRVTRGAIARLERLLANSGLSGCEGAGYCARAPWLPMVDFHEGDVEPPQVICAICGQAKMQVLIVLPGGYVPPEPDGSEWRPSC